MPARKALRAVAADEKAPAPQPTKTVTQAAKDGSTRELLVAMRDRTAKAVEDPNTAARDLAALTKRLMEIVRDIEAIDARSAEEDDPSASVEDGEFNAASV
jgi:hypothetical protein